MMFFPISYDEPLFRPPSEARSLILQVTLGCSWNRCAFCEMYTSKKFKVRKPQEVFDEIDKISSLDLDIKKVFLADGNALVLSTNKLIEILNYINSKLTGVSRISAYALPSDLTSKTEEELKLLNEKGLKLIYTGIETGDDELLQLIDKDESYASTLSGLKKAKSAGIKLSVMILNGLGGRKYSRQHAVNSARLVNELQPDYLSTLVLSFPYGEEQYRRKFKGEYIPMEVTELLEELRIFIEHTEMNDVIYRSDHASNYLVLKGILSRDKEMMLKKLDSAINNPDLAGLRPEYLRGLYNRH